LGAEQEAAPNEARSTLISEGRIPSSKTPCRSGHERLVE
jgi:hypothetical protein